MNWKKMDFSLGEEELKKLKSELIDLISKVKQELKKNKIKAEVFVGGSFGKNTLEKSDFYDVDIFVRFERKEKEISDKLNRVLKKTGEKFERVHGSRDYFRLRRENVDFEFIPVLKIKKVRDAENVTDLSYFHVNFVKRNLNERLRREILIAKKFCKAQRVYGAESYVNGFSGYALECLIINFKSFEKMLRELVKVKEKKLVIDIKKHYKKKDEALIEINEAKTKSPIILVDPTWKERNVLAALNYETLARFQESAREYFKKPSEKFFALEKKDFDSFSKRNSGEKVQLKLETDRQEGDIAGTKMKKFSRWVLNRLNGYFDVIDSEFVYETGQNALLFVAASHKKEVLRRGPLIEDKKNVSDFRKKNKKIFVKEGRMFARLDTGSLQDFLKDFLEKNSGIMKEMGVSSCQVAGK